MIFKDQSELNQGIMDYKRRIKYTIPICFLVWVIFIFLLNIYSFDWLMFFASLSPTLLMVFCFFIYCKRLKGGYYDYSNDGEIFYFDNAAFEMMDGEWKKVNDGKENLVIR